MAVKQIIITDVQLHPPYFERPFAIGRDRIGKQVSPIWFFTKSIPMPNTIVWVMDYGAGYRIIGKMMSREEYATLEVGDTYLENENVWVIGNDSVHISAGSEDSVNIYSKTDLHDKKITSLALCTDDHDAANKEYVDSVAPISAPHDIDGVIHTGLLGLVKGGTNNAGTYSSGKFVAYDGSKLASSIYDSSSFEVPLSFSHPLSRAVNTISLLYSATNLKENGSHQLDTIQDIATSSSPTFAGLTLSGLTAGRVLYAGAAKELVDNAVFTFDGTQLSVSPDTDTLHYMGRIKMGGISDYAYWGHYDVAQAGAALAQSTAGATYLNAASGQNVNFRINADTKFQLDSNGVFLAVGAARTVSAAAGYDLNIKMGDAAGANKIIFQSSTPATVASIDSLGSAYFTSLALAKATKTTTYTITSADHTIICNHAVTPFTITLPAATGTGRIYRIKNIGAALVTVQCNGAETLDGENSQPLDEWSGMVIVDYGAGVWVII